MAAKHVCLHIKLGSVGNKNRYSLYPIFVNSVPGGYCPITITKRPNWKYNSDCESKNVQVILVAGGSGALREIIARPPKIGQLPPAGGRIGIVNRQGGSFNSGDVPTILTCSFSFHYCFRSRRQFFNDNFTDSE